MNNIFEIMRELFVDSMLPLSAVMFANILLGLYRRIGVEKIGFDKAKFFSGILKAVCVASATLIFAAVLGTTGIGGDIVTPVDIVAAATILYLGKGITNLMGIYGVQLTADSKKSR